MSGAPRYSNFQSFEGTVSSEITLQFNWRPSKIIISNDSGSADLSFKFNSSETAGTLGPTETITLEMSSKTVIIDGSAIPYRVWGFG